MADDFDVEAMLEAPYQKSDEVIKKSAENGDGDLKRSKKKRRSRSGSHSPRRKRISRSPEGQRSKSRDRHGSKSRDRHRSKSRDRHRSKSRDRRRSKSRDRHRSKSRDRHRSKSRDRHRSKSHDRHRSKSREKRRSKSRDRYSSRSRERRRSRSRENRRSRSQEYRRHRERRHSRSKSPYYGGRDYYRKPGYSPTLIRRGGYGGGRGMRGSHTSSRDLIPSRPPPDDMTPEERDARTVFCMQLSARVRTRDIEEFFSSVGKVTDVRLITDNKTRRSKGICYVEFKEVSSVSLAMGLSGQKLLSVPILVQPSQAEKNRAAATATSLQKGNTGPMRLYIGSLHFNITEDMLKGIFEPFGKIDYIQLMMDPETNRSKGYGFITFHNSEDAKKALEQLNGFELAGRPMKVNHVTERTDIIPGPSFLDSEELDKTGIDLGATGRLHLMAKLAEGTGMELPPAAQTALNLNSTPAPTNAVPGQTVNIPTPSTQPAAAPAIATQCFMLSNMFDLSSDLSATWDQEIRDDVIEECRKHGGIVHIFVDKASPQGNVYVKCPTINSAAASVNSLHGRFFAGKVITAAYVPLINYHNLFPDALHSHNLL